LILEEEYNADRKFMRMSKAIFMILAAEEEEKSMHGV
jgi:hypothetical protein